MQTEQTKAQPPEDPVSESLAGGAPPDSASYSELNGLIATEVQLIWARYNAMLTAHAFVGVFLGALVSLGDWKPLQVTISIAASVFGLFLAWCWWRLTVDAWELCHEWVDVAKKITLPSGENPYKIYADWCKKKGCQEGMNDPIAKQSKGVILAFAVAYTLLLVVLGCWLCSNWKSVKLVCTTLPSS